MVGGWALNATYGLLREKLGAEFARHRRGFDEDSPCRALEQQEVVERHGLKFDLG